METHCNYCGDVLTKSNRPTKRFCCYDCRQRYWRNKQPNEVQKAFEYSDETFETVTSLAEIEDDIIPETVEFYELHEIPIRRIFLVCGPIVFRGKFDAFAAQVPSMMDYNLMEGDVFVFCNRTCHQLSVLQWQCQEFVIMFRRAEKYRYLWPKFNELKVIEISRTDLETLIEYPRFLGRISGEPTPQILL